MSRWLDETTPSSLAIHCRQKRRGKRIRGRSRTFLRPPPPIPPPSSATFSPRFLARSVFLCLAPPSPLLPGSEPIFLLLATLFCVAHLLAPLARRDGWTPEGVVLRR